MLTKRFLLFFVVFLLVIPQANAFWGLSTESIAAITKSVRALSEKEIIRLSKLSDEVKGTAKVGKELGQLNLSNDEIEDAFIRIAVHQKKLTRKTAEGMFSRLSDVPGFRTTLRKVIGNSDIGTLGHLNELKIADTASTNGFKVMAVGEKFSDGLKRAPTDIDVVLKREGKLFAIEAKNYASTTKIPMDKFRADLDTLVAYKNKNGNDVMPIFTITNKPVDLGYLKVLQHEAYKRGVQLVFGSPYEQVTQIKMLGKIL